MEKLTELEKELLIRIGYAYMGVEFSDPADRRSYQKDLEKAVEELSKLWD